MQKKQESLDVAVLREKIRIKTRDRRVYVGEIDRKLKDNREKRNALRIGNDCLRFMTRKQNQMSSILNAKIFEERSRYVKLPMLNCDLERSIVKNDARLFKYGKMLMKQDYRNGQLQREKEAKLKEMERDRLEGEAQLDDYTKKCEAFLHQQVRAEDYKSKAIAAGLIFQKYNEILAALDKDLSDYPFKIRVIEDKVKARKREVSDFMESKEGALRYLELEESALGPLNEELKMVSNHFEKIIAHERKELDERRKANALGKFLAEREAHVFNFTGSSSIMEMKIQARNKAIVNSQDMILSLMDAMLISDIKHVVDCILDQSDVMKLLEDERVRRLEENEDLHSDLTRLVGNNSSLKYNQLKKEKEKKMLRETLATEKDEINRQTEIDKCLCNQDKLMSNLIMAVHAMYERVRPIKIEENEKSGGLVEDTKRLIAKIQKMRDVVNNVTLPVGTVKPLLLRLFKEKRIPGDSIRVEMQQSKASGRMQVLEVFEAEKPGYTSREMLKSRAEEIYAKNAKKKAT